MGAKTHFDFLFIYTRYQLSTLKGGFINPKGYQEFNRKDCYSEGGFSAKIILVSKGIVRGWFVIKEYISKEDRGAEKGGGRVIGSMGNVMRVGSRFLQ